MKRRLRVPSPAFVVSLIALFVALGGTTYAATGGDTKVDTKLVKTLAPSLSVKHAKTADNATNAVNATDATHATSANSATSATSATTASALAGAEVVDGPTTSLASGTQSYEIVTCPTGMVAIGGGQVNNSNNPAVSDNSIVITTVSATNDSAQVYLNNGSAFSVNWNAYAICIHGSESGQS